MLYVNADRPFAEEDFNNPPAVYRGAPFWAWNCRITKEMIDDQIGYFKQMGMGGFHIHVRVGLKNQYMSEEFLELVRYCDEKAKENGMLCWLYDEDRYSSGYAGGEVTKKIPYRARFLRLTKRKMDGMETDRDLFLYKQAANEKVLGCLLGAYSISLEEGKLVCAERIPTDAEAKGEKWYLYEELEKETAWCNNQTYVDTMNSDATELFIEKTHERYAKVLKKEFGKSIPAIFTDEPHIVGMRIPARANGEDDIMLPFTEGLPERYKKNCGLDLWNEIPAIIWGRKEQKTSEQRYQFFDTCCSLFAESYCRTIGDWCEENGLLSTGHILGEETLESQACNVGDAMRSYREFQLPGIDNLCDRREFSAVKQAASVANQYGRDGVLSELYGVTQWDFGFEGYKLAGDWQAALGVTVRVPHLAWASMNGEAKRDYPAAIGWQSPWCQDFKYVEDHFARVNYCLTRGKPLVKVGVIHPVESMWTLLGPNDQYGDRKEQLERDFQNLTEWLLTGGIDFDYISEGLLEEEKERENTAEEKEFICGEMRYEVILVPDCIHLRKTTAEKLHSFMQRGGKVFLCGWYPEETESLGREELSRLLDGCEWLPVNRQELLAAMEPWREVEIRGKDGSGRDIYLHRLRQEGNNRWFFMAQAYGGMKARSRGAWSRRRRHEADQLCLRFRGEWEVERYDTLSGKCTKTAAWIENGWTLLECGLYGDDSLLLFLTPQTGKEKVAILPDKREEKKIHPVFIAEPTGYEMDEPNVFLMDRFEFALDDETEFHEECEILKLDNIIRKRLRMKLRSEYVEQPYVRKEPDVREHCLKLRLRFFSETMISGCRMAIEEPEYYKGFLNGVPIDLRPCGWYVDRALQTVVLPDIKRGENILELEMKFGNASNLEWMYLLGEFGVCVKGHFKYLTPKPDKLYWGDYTGQGFPFYTGNMTYYFSVPEKEGKPVQIQIPYFSGAAIRASAGNKEEMAAFLPYSCKPDGMKAGGIMTVTCLGHRFNGFGQLHLIGDDETWLGPDSWRTEGNSWTEEYQLKPMGILSAPVVWFEEE